MTFTEKQIEAAARAVLNEFENEGFTGADLAEVSTKAARSALTASAAAAPDPDDDYLSHQVAYQRGFSSGYDAAPVAEPSDGASASRYTIALMLKWLKEARSELNSMSEEIDGEGYNSPEMNRAIEEGELLLSVDPRMENEK